MALAAAVEAADPRAKVSYISLNFEEGHNAGYFVEPRIDPATQQPYVLGYNQVFVDPVTAEVRGRRDSTAVSLSRESLTPFLRTVHYSLHTPAMWGTDRLSYWIMGTVTRVWLLDNFKSGVRFLKRRMRCLRFDMSSGQETRPLNGRFKRWLGGTQSMPFRLADTPHGSG